MGTLTKLVHLGVDAAMITTILAGVKRSTGYTVTTHSVPEGTARDLANSYLNAGEGILDYASNFASSSSYFVNTSPPPPPPAQTSPAPESKKRWWTTSFEGSVLDGNLMWGSVREGDLIFGYIFP